MPDADDDAEPEPEPQYTLWGMSESVGPDDEEEDPETVITSGFDNDDNFASQTAEIVADDTDFGDFASFESASTDNFESFTASFPEPPPQPQQLNDDEVALIKNTMAGLHIAPPPWVRKMQQVSAIRQALAGSSQAPVADAAGSSAALDSQWAALAAQRSGPGGHLLTEATLTQASPLAAAGGAPTIGGMPGSLSGIAAAPKRVTAKQLAAERRALKAEKAKQEKERAAAASAAEVPLCSGSVVQFLQRRPYADCTYERGEFARVKTMRECGAAVLEKGGIIDMRSRGKIWRYVSNPDEELDLEELTREAASSGAEGGG